MPLNIGKVAKLFNISTETLRYYEQEGFLSPQKNKENGYREYRFEDLFLLTDLLFYRDIGIPIKDIKNIFDGISIEEITDLIGEKKHEIKKKLQHLTHSLIKLENWEKLHSESLECLNCYDIRPMPPALRKQGTFANYEEAFTFFQKESQMNSDLSFFLTFSFYCDLSAVSSGQTLSLQRYIVLDQTVADNLTFNFDRTNFIEESASRCLFTVVKFQHNIDQMLGPLFSYAQENHLELAGPIYGRQSINYYGEHIPQEYYRVYAALK